MANELRSFPIANLIQGVSQQTPQQRRETQAEAQFDCINSPINGCEARPGLEYINRLDGVDLTGAYCYEIFRGDEEHYLVVVTATAIGGHKLHVYNLTTGAPCTVTYTASEAYLDILAGNPQDRFCATTVNDFTFIANRDITVAMSTTNKSPAAYNEAILYFKAGAYSITYQATITYGGHVYVFTYTTPDNSVSGNAAYITTTQLAATFYRGFTGGWPTPHSSGDVLSSAHATGNGNVGATYTATGAVPSAPVTLSSLGFYVGINGNCLIIGRSDANPFKVDVTDGVGDTYFRCVKDTAQAFSDLPKSCFEGFTCLVKGTNKETDDDYYVKWSGSDGQGGYWVEVPKPGISLGFNPATAPHVLINTGVNTFEWKQPTWGDRVSGDGDTSSPDPSFVGVPIRDMFYDNSRLGILCEGTAVWSRARNPFVFFPDTAQTTLDTDPVDIEVAGGKTIALLRKVVQQDESTFLWAPKIQFRVSSGSNPFRQDTVEAKAATHFEFAANVQPASLADSVIFATEPGAWATVRDLLIQDGKPRGVTDITGHVRKYIPAGIRYITCSDTLGCIIVGTMGSKKRLYFYNFLVNEKDRLQSAWNIWRLPSGCDLLWVSLSQNYLHLMVQRADGAMFLRADLSVDLVDPVAGAEYLTRADLRVTEAATTVSYNSTTKRSTITLPFKVPEASGYFYAVPEDVEACPIFVVQRDSSPEFFRGKAHRVISVVDGTIVVDGDLTGQPLYIGLRIRSERRDSRFYLKDSNGLVPAHSLTVKNYAVSYSQTGYFRAETTYTNGKTAKYAMSGRVFGDPTNVTGTLPIREGTFTVPIDALNTDFEVNLINDSYLPSRWTTAQYHYVAAFLATPSGGGTAKKQGG